MCAHYAALRDLSVRYRTKAHSWPSALAVALVTGGAQSIRDILSLCAPAHRQRTEALLTVVHCARSIAPCISVGPQFQKVCCCPLSIVQCKTDFLLCCSLLFLFACLL